MPIEMPKGLPFSVDTWNHSSVKKRHHFLTHAHKDHSNGISTHFSYPIYSTHLTKTLVIQQHPQVVLVFPFNLFVIPSHFFLSYVVFHFDMILSTCLQDFSFFFPCFSNCFPIFVVFCSSISPYLWLLRLGRRWLSMTQTVLSLLQLSMQITALVFDS